MSWSNFLVDFMYLVGSPVSRMVRLTIRIRVSVAGRDQRTPTSRYLTSRHSTPKSFMRAKASSLRFPEFSQPDVTSGNGMSLHKHVLTSRRKRVRAKMHL